MIVVEQFKRTDLTNRAMASVYFHMGIASMITFLCLAYGEFGGIALSFCGFAVAIAAGYVASEDVTARRLDDVDDDDAPPPPANEESGLA